MESTKKRRNVSLRKSRRLAVAYAKVRFGEHERHGMHNRLRTHLQPTMMKSQFLRFALNNPSRDHGGRFDRRGHHRMGSVWCEVDGSAGPA